MKSPSGMRRPLKKVSAKKLKALGGKVPFSTITGPRKPLKKSRKPIRARKADPTKRRFAARRDKAFTDWIADRGCHLLMLEVNVGISRACWHPWEETREGRYADPAHIKTRGTGAYDVGEVIPLCRKHHREQHAIGIRSWQTKYALDLKTLAADYAARYLADHPSVPHVSSEGTP